MRGKRGDKYFFMVSLILGLMVVALGMYFLFHEYFTQEDINWETCRQSVVIRGTLPDASTTLGITIEQFKAKFPIKCKTEVVELETEPPEINWADNNEVYLGGNVGSNPSKKIEDYKDKLAKEITDRMLECWSILGSGDYNLFPKNWFAERKSCIICYRIDISEETEEFFRRLGSKGSTTSFRSVNLANYITSHDFQGNKLPISIPLDDDGNLDPAQIVPGQDRHLWPLFDWMAFYKGSTEKFVFYEKGKKREASDEDNTYGVRHMIDFSEGDIVIGGYFYSNHDLGWYSIDATVYDSRYPFYAQPNVDGTYCDLYSIPA